MNATVDIHVIAIVVPSCESPCWKIITEPLLKFIKDAGGRSMTEILKWGKMLRYPQNFSRHLLAWLSFNDIVFYDEDRKIWVAH